MIRFYFIFPVSVLRPLADIELGSEMAQCRSVEKIRIHVVFIEDVITCAVICMKAQIK